MNWVLCNCNQCWQCKHQIGKKSFELSKVISLTPLKIYVSGLNAYINMNAQVDLPECEIMDQYMFEIYHSPCDKFEYKIK